MTMTAQNDAIKQIAMDLVEHCRSGTNDDTPLWDKHFAPDFVSVEGDGKTFKGREELLAKHKQWHDDVTMHGGDVTGPFVGPTGFSVIFDMDIESNSGMFPRMKMREIADYTVENGKVVREEFRFDPAMCQG
ncbi:MAG: SnoaL-like domain-containing protein [Phycisphaerales bacterium]